MSRNLKRKCTFMNSASGHSVFDLHAENWTFLPERINNSRVSGRTDFFCLPVWGLNAISVKIEAGERQVLYKSFNTLWVFRYSSVLIDSSSAGYMAQHRGGIFCQGPREELRSGHPVQCLKNMSHGQDRTGPQLDFRWTWVCCAVILWNSSLWTAGVYDFIISN